LTSKFYATQKSWFINETSSVTFDVPACPLCIMFIDSVPGIGKVTYVYDIVENMQQGECAETAKYPQGEIVTKVYDKAGRLSKVVACGDTTKYNYYDNGSVQSVVYDNGAKEEYTYTANNL